MATQLQGMGLFGMPTAQEARQQYEQGLMLTPAQMGSQGLLQQVVSTIAQGGAGAGYGLGRMMGGMAPQEAEAMGMEQAMQEVTAMGITDPTKKMTALADALQKRGLSRAAMQALEKGRAMRVQDLQSQQAEAGLMTLKPIKGAMRVVGKDSLGNPVYKQDIIGYQQGSRFMTPEQAEAYIKGLSPDEAAAATGAPPPPPPRTKRQELEASLAEDRAKRTGEQQTSVEQAGLIAAPTGGGMPMVRDDTPSPLKGALKPLELAEQRAARDVTTVRANARAALVAQYQTQYAKAKTPAGKRMALEMARQVGVSAEEVKGTLNK